MSYWSYMVDKQQSADCNC